jgi:hypothetical protein
MPLKKAGKYHPTEREIQAMHLCNRNDLAYLIQPIKGKTLYNVIKFEITNYLNLYFLKDGEKNLEFTEIEGMKKTMELYLFHSKRFEKLKLP